LNQNKITLHYTSRQNQILRVTTFGAHTIAESTIKTFEEFQIEWDYLKARSSEILGLLRRAADRGYADSDFKILEKLKELGGDLYGELVPPSIHEKLTRAAGGNLLLSIDQDLAGIPWEILYDGQGFLCRRYHMGRIISIPPSVRRKKKRRIEGPVQLLSITDPEGDLPGAFQEGLRIRDLCLDSANGVQTTFFARDVKLADFYDGLKHCDLLHFAGHIESEQGKSRIRLSDGACTAARIGQLAGRFPFPTLVFLNGCRSTYRGGDALSRSEQGDRAFDLASGFLLSGARHFIGTLWDIQDVVGAQAGISFFKAFLSGMSVGSALAKVRSDLISAYGEATMIWAGYLLFGDPGFRIEGHRADRDQILMEMNLIEEMRANHIERLDSQDAEERFLAAVALFQTGDLRAGEILMTGNSPLFGLLDNSVRARRQEGEKILEILIGTRMGFRADADSGARSRILESVRAWWASEEAIKRFGTK